MHKTTQPTSTILVADDNVANLRLLERTLVPEGYHVVRATSGEEALQIIERNLPDLILLDVLMPGVTGFEVCRRLKQNPVTRLTPVVLITALSSRDDKIQGITAGADDFLTKPVNKEELLARVRSLVRLKRYTDDLDSAESVILSLALTVEARDPYTHEHCQRLAIYASGVGRRLGLPPEDVAALDRGGYLHDIGKIAVSDNVLLKPGHLTPEEFDIIKQHPVVGDRLCGNMRFLQKVRPIVRHHHERLDGGGYPDGLRGDRIPLLAQIVNIVDIYDAITTNRPYRKSLSHEIACEELLVQVRRGWRSKELVQTFLEVLPGLRADSVGALPAGGVPTVADRFVSYWQ